LVLKPRIASKDDVVKRIEMITLTQGWPVSLFAGYCFKPVSFRANWRTAKPENFI
jgi:hypothetical protein